MAAVPRTTERMSGGRLRSWSSGRPATFCGGHKRQSVGLLIRTSRRRIEWSWDIYMGKLTKTLVLSPLAVSPSSLRRMQYVSQLISSKP